MSHRRPIHFAALLWGMTLSLALTASLPALAADHDESNDGDLSGDPANPTVIAVDEGPNVISGFATDNPLDRDIFTLVVPAGLEVTEIRLTAFNLVTSPSDGGMLLAVEQGPRITDLNSAASLRGFAIVGVAPGTEQGDDLLDDLGGGVLGPGEWTLWLQNTGSVTEYTLTVQASVAAAPPPVASRTEPVPGPGLLALMGLLLGVSLIGARALRHGSKE
jgi:hypothetical protein